MLGCASNTRDSTLNFLGEVRESQLEISTPCRELVGLGSHFQGVPCATDNDCQHIPPFQCDRSHNVCALGPLKDVEDAYLACYIARMDDVNEFFVRRDLGLGNEYSKSDPEFFSAFRAQASGPGCASSRFALENQFRPSNIYDAPSLSCKADQLGLTLPQDEAKLLAECGPQRCLDSSCKFRNDECYEKCYPRISLERNACPVDEKFCNVNLPEEDCDGRYVCAYCRPSGFFTQCTHIEGITSEEECMEAIACELPNGEIVTGLSEQECVQSMGSCSVDCEGEMCASLNGIGGVCATTVTISQPDCENIGNSRGVEVLWYTDFSGQPLCVLPEVGEADCEEVSGIIFVLKQLRSFSAFTTAERYWKSEEEKIFKESWTDKCLTYCFWKCSRLLLTYFIVYDFNSSNAPCSVAVDLAKQWALVELLFRVSCRRRLPSL